MCQSGTDFLKNVNCIPIFKKMLQLGPFRRR